MTIEIFLAFAIGAGLGWVVNTYLNAQVRLSFAQEMTKRAEVLASESREEEARYIEVLRRELANEIMRCFPRSMLEAYDKVATFETEYLNGTDEFRSQKLQKISEKERSMGHGYDLLEIRHFVPYSEAFENLRLDELVDHYIFISQVLCTILATDGLRRLTSEDERWFLEEWVEDLTKDT